MSNRDKKLLNKSNINKDINKKLNKHEIKKMHSNIITEYEWKESSSKYFLHRGDVKSPVKLRYLKNIIFISTLNLYSSYILYILLL
jgi:hypothetical protein